MKSDREFLDGMWQKVEYMELELKEKEQALRVSRQIRKRNIILCSILSLPVIGLLLLIKCYGKEIIYIAAAMIIILAYVTEHLISCKS